MRPGEPWTLVVEEGIRDVAASLDGDVHALGGFVDDQLVAVAVFRYFGEPPQACRIYYLAVANGHQRQGHARELKVAVLGTAREAGASVVDSIVDRRNGPVLALNRSLGAVIDVIDPEDPEYVVCVIRL
jgi:ribosomal protein S18 acetylase RimI-like enzyme